MNNHLIIGLGGTGGKVIRSLRKTVYSEFRDNNPENPKLDYLYIDTSDEMMSSDNSSWRVLGNSVSLDEGSKVHIAPIGLPEVLSNVKLYPGIKDWIGDTTLWSEFLGGAAGLKTAGGQRRRLGRFILACNIDKFTTALVTQVQKLQEKSGQSDITFHVCAGLAGGTGSGSLIDVISQIRDIYKPTSNIRYRIILYLFLPDRTPPPKWDASYYHSNGYAALLELNAYECGVYKPFNLSLKNNTQEARLQHDGVDKFAGAYIFTNVNENGSQINTDIDIPNMVADFIFQKNIAASDDNWLSQLNHIENNENCIPPLEKTSQSLFPERSLRFQTFGIKRIAIPEEEIREYITYSFAKQAVLQLRFNNWSDETGFRNEAVNQNYFELAANRKTHEQWRITDEHFQLSLPIIEDSVTKKWKRIGDTWRFLIPEYVTTVKESKDANWLLDLKKLCEKQFSEQYRNIGVKKFYEAKAGDKKDLAKEIVGRIENDIFNEWKNGIKSLFDCKNIINALVDHLEKRFGDIDDKLIKNQQYEENLNTTVLENEKTWANVGMLSAIAGKKGKLLDGQATVLEELYIYKTQAEGLRFAKTLISETIECLNGLKTNIENANRTLESALQEFDNHINERINDDESTMSTDEKYKQQLIRFYNPDKVRSITKRLTRDKREQDTQTSSVRNLLVDKLGGQPSFYLFNQRINKASLVSEFEKTCDQNARNAEANLKSDEKLFDSSIIEKLKEKYDGNHEELGRYIKKLIDFSGCYLDFDNNEINKVGDGCKEGPTKIRTLAVLIPQYNRLKNDSSSFVYTLIKAFEAKAPNGIKVEFYNMVLKNNEIVIFSLTNGFPLRYSSHIGYLRQKYQERISKEDGLISKLFLHSEDNIENFPKLFVPSQKELEQELEKIQQESIPYILLANLFGLIQEKVDDHGYSKLAFVKLDKFGDFVPQFFLDKKISECFKAIDRKSYEILKKTIDPIYDEEYRFKDKKEDLVNKLIKLVKSIHAERGNEDRIYTLHKAEASKLIDNLNV